MKNNIALFWLLTALAAPVAALAQTTVSVPEETKVQNYKFEYFDNGLVQYDRREPDGVYSAGVKLVRQLKLPDQANRGTDLRAAVATGWDGAATVNRTVTTDYGTDGRFPVEVKNDLFTQETREYDARFGLPTLVSDANGVTTKFEYDSFGRKVKEERGYASATATAFVNYSSWTYERCADVSGGCAAVQGVAPVMVVTTKVYSSADAKIAPVEKRYLDRLGRELRVETESVRDGIVVLVRRDTVYNAKGQVDRASLPYVTGDTAYFAHYEYDELGRKKTETAPNGLVTSIARSGTTTTVTVHAEDGDRVRTTEVDLAGLPRKVTDPKNHAMYFVHDGQGSRTHVIDTYGNQMVSAYDAYGRRTAVTDRDVGVQLTYTPNAFGDIGSETDGLGRVTTRSFDALGRVKTVSEPDLTSTFVFDSATNGKGKLHKSYTDNGYCRTHAYDTTGRPLSNVVDIGAATPCATTATTKFTSSVTYDSAGRLLTTVFPTGLTIKNNYHATLGFQTSAYNYTGGIVGTSYWTWKGEDAFGHVTDFLLAGNVRTLKEYDPATAQLTGILTGTTGNASLGDVQQSDYDYTLVGDLRLRSDKFDLPDMFEKAQHDALGRLSSYARYTSATGSEIPGTKVSMTYDAIGNIKTKSDVGTYYYNSSGTGSVRPHAVAEIRGTVNDSLVYETGTGNLLSAVGRKFTYSSNGQITEAGAGANCHRFVYQGEGMRFQQSVYSASCSAATESSMQSQTLYLHPDAGNGLYFEREKRGSKTYYKHYLAAGGQSVGMLVTETDTVTANTAVTFSAFHQDHLGSIVATTNASGTVTERRSFDAWGRARATDGTPTDDGELPKGLASVTDRGYTMHEHLEGLGLLHMNGRAYDFTVGHFTSPDPFVPQPDDMQSYNRYAYVMNRPLNSTDPTGYFDEDKGYGGGLSSLLYGMFGVYGEGGGRGSSGQLSWTWMPSWLNGGTSANGTSGSGQFQPERSYGASMDYTAAAQFGQADNGSRGATIQQLDRAFEKAQAAGDLDGMQRLFAGYLDVAGIDPSSAMHVFMWNNVIARAQRDAGQTLGYGDIAPAAAASFYIGVSGMPTGAPRTNAGLPGTAVKGKLRIDPNGSFSKSETEAAWYMASLGKSVVLRSPKGSRADGGTSDLLVNGVRYDVYTPTSSNPNRIISSIAKKNSQAQGVVLDLTNSSVTRAQLGNVLGRVNGAGATNIRDVVIFGGN
jgi:RHS repeat-associated protein